MKKSFKTSSDIELEQLTDRIHDICEEQGLVSLVFVQTPSNIYNNITGYTEFLKVGIRELEEHIEEEEL